MAREQMARTGSMLIPWVVTGQGLGSAGMPLMLCRNVTITTTFQAVQVKGMGDIITQDILYDGMMFSGNLGRTINFKEVMSEIGLVPYIGNFRIFQLPIMYLMDAVTDGVAKAVIDFAVSNVTESHQIGGQPSTENMPFLARNVLDRFTLGLGA